MRRRSPSWTSSMATTDAHDPREWAGTRVVPAQNCYRWYRVWVQPDLFNDWVVWTAWGRLGSAQYRQRLYPVADCESATALVQHIIARKIRRGYRSHPSF
uniref:WGR domain-containing protein n=2 Tax=Sulfobacillus thermotolerans TaxID=338644 RepID=G5CIY0_9FIRM|nr:WGR domain-containing protein [Sulfobacillus thermotolerans]